MGAVKPFAERPGNSGCLVQDLTLVLIEEDRSAVRADAEGAAKAGDKLTDALRLRQTLVFRRPSLGGPSEESLKERLPSRLTPILRGGFRSDDLHFVSAMAALPREVPSLDLGDCLAFLVFQGLDGGPSRLGL